MTPELTQQLMGQASEEADPAMESLKFEGAKQIGKSLFVVTKDQEQ